MCLDNKRGRSIKRLFGAFYLCLRDRYQAYMHEEHLTHKMILFTSYFTILRLLSSKNIYTIKSTFYFNCFYTCL